MDKKANLALGAVSLVLGLVLSLQFKSVLRTKTNDSAQLARAEQLQLELTAEQEKNEALYNQLMQYKEELAQLRIQAEETGGVSDMFAERLRQMELLAGVTDVSGQGVTVTKPGEIAGAVEHAIQSGLPTVIDVKIDRDITVPLTTTWQMPPIPPALPTFGKIKVR